MTRKAMTRAALLAVGAMMARGAAAGPISSDAEFARAVGLVRAQVAREMQERALTSETVISDVTTPLDVELNAATVKCSRADYSLPMLKVLVPGLAALTVLNHRNAGEGAPCVAAGACGPRLGPGDILGHGEGVERVPVRVVLRKDVRRKGDVCHVSLVETVTLEIRRVSFGHVRTQAVAERVAADCR